MKLGGKEMMTAGLPEGMRLNMRGMRLRETMRDLYV
jgi:hypothetical protein